MAIVVSERKPIRSEMNNLVAHTYSTSKPNFNVRYALREKGENREKVLAYFAFSKEKQIENDRV